MVWGILSSHDLHGADSGLRDVPGGPDRHFVARRHFCRGNAARACRRPRSWPSFRLLIPNTLPYTLPTTTLFATCIIYGRLAHDNEILAIKAAGINMLHVIFPGRAARRLASAATFVLYMDLIPSTHNILRNSFVSDVEELIYMMLKRDGRFCSDKVDYEIYVKRVENRTLIEAEFRRRNPKTKCTTSSPGPARPSCTSTWPRHKLKVSMHNWLRHRGDGNEFHR